MTTIAASIEHGCMAADTRVSSDTGSSYPATKIFRIGQSLFGTAGHGSMCLVMIEWLKTNRNRRDLYKQWGDYFREDIWLMELSPKGLFLWDGWGVPEPLLTDRYAVGSGMKAANILLRKGMTPREAVEGATEVDIYTHAPVQEEWLIPPELIAKPRRRKRA